ncbi:MAG: polysaccharide pyruvyl transferase family protein [Hyphomonadaceae bacterium]
MPDALTLATDVRSETRRPRIALFGGYGSGNFGNDASLEAILTFLRQERPDAELSSICSGPDFVTRRYGLPAIPNGIRPKSKWGNLLDKALLRQPSLWASWVHCLGVLGKHDAVLVCGTGVFDDFRDHPFGWPSRLLRWGLAARARGVKLSYVSVGAGPIVHPLSRMLMKWAAQLGCSRSYRDADSRDFMLRLGVDDSASDVLPDLAFLLPRRPEAARPAGPLTIGVGIMTYRGWHASEEAFRAYLGLHERLIRWIEAQGHRVKVVIGQTPADLVAVRELERMLGRPLLSEAEEKMDCFHDAMAAIAETDLVVASRYHVQIAALKMRRPLISLGYAPKNDALMEQAGLAEFVHDVESTDFAKLTQQIEAIARQRDKYAAIVDENVTAMEQRLRRALLSLDAIKA